MSLRDITIRRLYFMRQSLMLFLTVPLKFIIEYNSESDLY